MYRMIVVVFIAFGGLSEVFACTESICAARRGGVFHCQQDAETEQWVCRDKKPSPAAPCPKCPEVKVPEHAPDKAPIVVPNVAPIADPIVIPNVTPIVVPMMAPIVGE